MYPAVRTWLLLLLALGSGMASLGCSTPTLPSPVQAGYNTRDLIDVAAQAEAYGLAQSRDQVRLSHRLRPAVTALVNEADPAALRRPPRHVLCLSGGGSMGAFSVGVLSGWTRSGARPEFDVVTGISTGALIAPLAFLGPEYDRQLEQFYTSLENDDIYSSRPVRRLFKNSLADNTPLVKTLEAAVTPELLNAIGCEHAKGRRLYVGTTEIEGRRLVIWDLGAIAQAGDVELFRQVLLGSSAIPGLFPPARIQVTVNGKTFEELHGDGATCAALFFRPPYLPVERRSDLSAANLYNTHVWCVVAGKLYPDVEECSSHALGIATNGILTRLHAKTRDDLTHVFNLCALNGMHFHVAAIPRGASVPHSSTEFNPSAMSVLFELGTELARRGRAWRDTPPGFLEVEADLERAGTNLVERDRAWE